jgi:TANFOR domain-containing protein
MFLHFNRKFIKQLFLFVVIIVSFCHVQSQSITQMVSVTPPYSNKLSDYIATPGKINVIINAPYGMDGIDLQFYMHGSLISADESIIIRTKKNYKPTKPMVIKVVHLPSGGVSTQPYIVSYNDIRQIFDDINLEFIGITRQEVMQNGLPDGFYTFCFDILFYPTNDNLVSSCSAPFSVLAVDAPIIISPANNIMIREPEARNLIFTWTRPARAPISTKYKLKIIELNDINDNFQDKIRNLAYPAFFETTIVGSNTYLYSYSNPALKPGKTYAFVVAAIDPLGTTSFLNHGFSEVQIFTYQSNEQKPMSGTLNMNNPKFPKIQVNHTIIPPMLKSTTLQGTLKYQYKNGTTKWPLSKTKIKLVEKYIVRNSDGTINVERTRIEISNLTQNQYNDGDVIAVATTNENGAFTFTFLSNYNNQPLRDVSCYDKVAEYYNSSSNPFEYQYADASYRNQPGGPNAEVMDYSYISADNSCKLYKAYAIVIEGEHARYYLNPDQNIAYFFEIKGGETKDIGEVISLVKTVDINVLVTSKENPGNFTINNTKELANMNVFLFRKVNFDYPPIFPTQDVTPDKTDGFPAPVAGMVCVGQGLTDKNGIAPIKSLVFSDNPTYQYYVYVNNSQDYNYESDAPVMINFSELVKGNINGQYQDQTTPGYDLMLKQHSANSYFSTSHSSIINGYSYKVELPLRYPTLVIELREKEGYKKISQPAIVILTEKYHKGNQKFDLSQNFSPLNQDITQIIPMALCDTGTYKLDNLGGEVKVYPSALIGPYRTVTIKVQGFVDTTIIVKNGGPLKWGERYKMIIPMRYGAQFTGNITEAGTQKPLPNAYVSILGETSKSTTTDQNGNFYLEVRKLETLRTVVISRYGFMNDTVTIKLNKAKNQYYFELYRKTRKLRVIVWGNNDYAKGVKVSLPNVPKEWKTDYSKLPTGQNMNYSGIQINPNITQGVIGKGLIPKTNTPPAIQGNPKIKPNQNTSINNNQSIQNNQNITFEEQYYTVLTDNEGIAEFDFSGGQTDRFKIIISNPPNSSENFVQNIQEIDIPYSKTLFGTVLQVDLEEGGCLSGIVYLGETNNKPLAGVNIIATINGQSEPYNLTTKTDASGKYTLKNIPVNQPFKLQVTTGKPGENFVGFNNDQYTIKSFGNNCQTESFHLKTIDGIDVSTFLGFPFAATDYQEQQDGNVLLTGIVTLSSNPFFNEQKINISGAKMKKSNVKNSNGDYYLIPVDLPFLTDMNSITVSIYSNYSANITDPSGLKFDLLDPNQVKGEIEAGVQINQNSNNSNLNGNFGGFGYKLPDLFLSLQPNQKKPKMVVYTTSGQVNSANIGTNGFYLSDGENETLTYSVDGFENGASVEIEKSFFDQNGLTLFTTLKANISTINPSNIQLDAGIININKKGLTTAKASPFKIQMKNWTLNCNQWSITNEGVKVSSSILNTGIDVKIENLIITSQSLLTDKAIVHLENVKLLGLKDVKISTSHKGLVYKYLHNGVYGWSLYAVPDQGQTIVATLKGMPGLAPNDQIEFTAVDFNSEGESVLALNSHKFRIYNIVDFTPFPFTQMYVTPTSLKLTGTYDFGIPEYMKPTGAMGYFKENNQIAFALMDMDAFSFTHHNVQYKLTQKYLISDRQFIAKGTIEEPGNLPVLNVTSYHTPTSTKIEIDPGQDLPMGSGKELFNLIGGINVVNHSWDVLRFEGELKGLKNIAAGQKMNFEVKGAVQATNQKIGVSDIPSFPGLTITYDMMNSRFIGCAALDMNLSGFKLQGNVTTIMDNQGWLFNTSGLVEIPGIGSANCYGLFGNYSNLPPEVSNQIGNAICLPNEFKTNLNGFFLSAGLTKQILPKIDYNYGIVAITAGVDVSVNARTYMIFGQGSTFGLGILAEGHAYLGGSCPATCTSANADAKLQLGISGDYNTQSHYFNIDGCTSLNLKISASQCVPVLIDCGPCVSVSLADFTIGASVHLDNSKGFSMGLTTTSCDQQCK